jgi:hypothetical protein
MAQSSGAIVVRLVKLPPSNCRRQFTTVSQAGWIAAARAATQSSSLVPLRWKEGIGILRAHCRDAPRELRENSPTRTDCSWSAAVNMLLWNNRAFEPVVDEVGAEIDVPSMYERPHALHPSTTDRGVARSHSTPQFDLLTAVLPLVPAPP